ncbi:MAG: drug resistance transporter, EmrB/QacA subfamily [Gemmatimonadetes bacterium]|nr:drug resistance transporter, EmrB/QacA subfamily [Gemmatimonadota bacterium]
MTASDEPERTSKWRVLASVVFGVFMVTLDTTAVNVAFPVIRSELGASLHEAQWLVSVYVLALGMSTPVAGFLADRFGLKRMYIVGLAIFVVGSLCAGLAPTLPTLVIARALKGIGGGIAVPCGTALLFRGFSKSELGLALGVFGLALLFAPALGPVLGGWLVDHQLWRWIFFINVPIGTLGILVASRFLVVRPGDVHAKWDGWGLVTAIPGFGALLYVTALLGEEGWSSPRLVAWLAVGIVSLAAFAYVELRVAPSPLLDLRLFRRPVFLIATLVGYVTVIAFFGAEFLLPVYLQSLRGAPALTVGLVLLPLALCAGLLLPLAGVVYDRIGPRALVVGGFALLCYNTWQLAHIGPSTSLRFLVMLTAIRGFALGLTVQTPFTAALADVEHDALPRATSLVSSTRYLVQAYGIAALATLLGTRLVGGGQVTLEGFHRAYMLTFWLSIVGMVLGVLLPGWPGRVDRVTS